MSDYGSEGKRILNTYYLMHIIYIYLHVYYATFQKQDNIQKDFKRSLV